MKRLQYAARPCLITLFAIQMSAFQEKSPHPAVPVQPVPFSHKEHVKLALKCQDCHPNPDPGEVMTLPKAQKCMACHVSVAKDAPAIQKLAEYAKNKQDIPWVRVYHLPDWVFWSHRTHLNAGVTCSACHDSVASADLVTKLTNVTTMGGCVTCHEKQNAPTGCQLCHEDKRS